MLSWPWGGSLSNKAGDSDLRSCFAVANPVASNFQRFLLRGISIGATSSANVVAQDNDALPDTPNRHLAVALAIRRMDQPLLRLNQIHGRTTDFRKWRKLSMKRCMEVAKEKYRKKNINSDYWEAPLLLLSRCQTRQVLPI